MAELAQQTALAVGFEFLGVDVVEDANGKQYVLEANYPHDFAGPQKYVDTDIARTALDYLNRKSLLAGEEFRSASGNVSRLRSF